MAYLTGGVYYLRGKILIAVLDDFAECVLNSRIVAVHEVAIHKLNREGGFS